MDLTEIETFLALSEELHFGRTAERLRLSQSRVSQLIRSLERRIGAPLFNRTSRRVSLTPLGEHARDTLGAAHTHLKASYEEACAMAQGVVGALRVGFLGCLNGPPLTDVVLAFGRQHPACDIAVAEVPWTDLYGPLRAGEIDILLTLLPVDEPDLKVGAVLVSHGRALAVALGHTLAERESVDIEDLSDQVLLNGPAELPEALRYDLCPPFTPLGRPLRRATGGRTYQEALHRVASGEMVWTTHEGLFRVYAHPGVVYRPLSGLPLANGALVWRADGENAKVRAFVSLAAQSASGRTVPSASLTA
ncbi:LysR family transcriptional regulator [Streptomyces beihaiensis]|uniref:LysR family transcriptional regulator n=1 Tax=Streptomyces beihaiensis TaxID=2984495 RepID=A0ABT3TX96_9ACTN|nr:LysR family transcriptional regulator [Streptomyces beihaiensis]MCX3061111.1 LysR family transcriptional regulator [Streptomyces beihaiensis]